MDGKTYEIELTLTEPMLGTTPKDPEIYKSYIASKAPEPENVEDEIESVQATEERGWTGFHLAPNGTPFLYDFDGAGETQCITP